MENQDDAMQKPSAGVNLPGNPLDRPNAGGPAAPATGIHSGGDRLLYGRPHPDGAAPAASGSDIPENGTSSAGRPSMGRVARNPLGTVVFAVAAGFLLGRLLP